MDEMKGSTVESSEHWDRAYLAQPETGVSWFQASPVPSLKALDELPIALGAALIDVGGGASNLVDSLIERRMSDLTVLDISTAALEAAKQRLGASARLVQWEVADITAWRPRRTYDVWHDRAVFHFLTDAEGRRAYRLALEAATVAGSFVIIATFAPDGPERCSGLAVQRYNPAALLEAIGPEFDLLQSWREEHITPNESRQVFNWCIFERR